MNRRKLQAILDFLLIVGFFAIVLLGAWIAAHENGVCL